MIRLRDSLIKMGEELSQATTAEAQQRESSQYYQRRLEELKADMQELVEREAEASRRCMELVSVVLRWFWAGGFEIGERLESGGGSQKERGREAMLPLAAISGARGAKRTNGVHSWMVSECLCVPDSRSSLSHSTPKAGRPREKQGIHVSLNVCLARSLCIHNNILSSA